MFLKSYVQAVLKTRRLNQYLKYVKQKPGFAPDIHRYTPYFEPWHHNPEFQSYLEISKNLTVVPPERIWIIVNTLRNAIKLTGAVCEFGVYKGGTALVLSKVISESEIEKDLYLYDSFEGMPSLATKNDWHDETWFKDTSLEKTTSMIGNSEFLNVKFVKGIIPQTLLNVSPEKICFAHIDLDLYMSVIETLHEIYNKIVAGGIILIDDYGEPTCYGARLAVDEFFNDKPEFPIILPTGQALVVRSQ